MKQLVYSFNEGSRDMTQLLGIKGANLAEMSQIGLPVPFGFTITAEACRRFYDDNETISQELMDAVRDKISELENVTGKIFGSGENPLLVSVRSGAAVSMPGMMDTVLNLGLNDESVEGLSALTENRRFAMDSYRRFIQMFGEVVLGIPKTKFDEIFDGKKSEKKVRFDVELTAEDLEETVDRYKELVLSETGRDFPQNPKEQLLEAVKAVFRSWKNDRAVLYRKINKISSNLGTAVNVQAMVFGNMGDSSCTGVAFSRNPSDGTNQIFGEFLMNAQGEDVVAGIRTPQNIEKMEEMFPELYKSFIKIAELLEKHNKDMQEMEFTIENNKLYMLQTRNGNRTARAAVKIAVDMVNEGLIDERTAVTKLQPEQIDQLLHPEFDLCELQNAVPIAKGLPASPGACWGKICFRTEDAEREVRRNHKVILVREETSPEDLAGMVAAEGILTARGGMTSHAAVIARGMGKCCVSGCSQLRISEKEKMITAPDGKIYREGEYLSLNGNTGQIYAGKVETVKAELSEDFNTLMEWADEIRELKIRANADNLTEARQADEFGAEGIGLFRTEYMFFSEKRMQEMRKLILADTPEKQAEVAAVLKPMQQKDFEEIYKVMGDRPVTIRLLDPPLSDFLPQSPDDIRQLAETLGLTYEETSQKIEELQESNPMMGHRGCRLAVTLPAIVVMQTAAIIDAAIAIKKEFGYDIEPEIMIPLVSSASEMKTVKKIVMQTADRCIANSEIEMEYMVGIMIETPRAAITADELAKEADFFSFGTNDLTQLVYGLSRDDTGKLIETYMEDGLFTEDPFQTLDQDGVGRLVSMAAKAGRQTKPKIKLGICGEHGGDPKTIAFCNALDLSYVSCSPYRVPAARLAAAQSVVHSEEEKEG